MGFNLDQYRESLAASNAFMNDPKEFQKRRLTGQENVTIPLKEKEAELAQANQRVANAPAMWNASVHQQAQDYAQSPEAFNKEWWMNEMKQKPAMIQAGAHQQMATYETTGPAQKDKLAQIGASTAPAMMQAKAWEKASESLNPSNSNVMNTMYGDGSKLAAPGSKPRQLLPDVNAWAASAEPGNIESPQLNRVVVPTGKPVNTMSVNPQIEANKRLKKPKSWNISNLATPGYEFP